MRRKTSILKNKSRSSGRTFLDQEHVSALDQTRSTDNFSEFKSLLTDLLPELHRYIVRRLNIAHATGLIHTKVLNPQEIIDAAYIELYERFSDKPESAEFLRTWAYRIADETLDRELNEVAYEEERLVDVDNIEQMELSELEEKYSIDADGELVMMDELDDISYNPELYESHLILEDVSPLQSIDDMIEANDKQIVHAEIRKLLIMLPEQERSIFDLYWLGGLEMEQIADIKNISTARAEEILKMVTRKVKEKLEIRFSIKL